MRVTDRTSLLMVSADMARARAQLAASQRQASSGLRLQQASSGLRLQQASDDPAGAARLLATDEQRAALTTHRASIGTALGQLQAADGALESMTDALGRAQELALQMANGSISAADRAGAAAEAHDLHDQILALANTRVDGVYIFNGQQTQVAPFDAGGNFVGDGGTRRILAAPGLPLQASVSAREALTAAGGGRDVLADLDALATALASNDIVGVQAAVGQLAQGQRQVVETRARAGLLSARLSTLDSQLSDRGLQLDQERSRIADADSIAAVSDMARAQQALNTALQVSAGILNSLSLVDKL